MVNTVNQDKKSKKSKARMSSSDAGQSRSKPFYRRWAFLLGTLALLLAIAGGGAVYVVSSNTEETVDVGWDEVMKPIPVLQASERYEEIIDHFSDVKESLVSTERTDVLRAYAEARLMVSEEGNAHVREAIQVLRRIDTLNPEDTETVRQLFQLYSSMSDDDLAIQYGDRVLELDPNDDRSMVELGDLLLEADDTTRSVELANAAVDINPGNIDAYRVAIRGMLANGASDEDITNWISEKVGSASAQGVALDTNSLMLLYARESNDDQLAQILLAKIVEAPLSGSENARLVSTQLQKAGDTIASTRVLREALQAAEDAGIADDGNRLTTDSLAVSLLYRQLQLGLYDELLQLIETSFAGTERYDDRILGVEFLARAYTAETEKLPALAEKMAEYDTQFSRVWQPLLVELSRETLNGKRIIELTKTALETFPGSAHLRYWQAIGYEAAGEVDQAIRVLRQTTRVASGWVMPRLQLSRLFLERGDLERGLVESATALRSSPGLQPAIEYVFAAVVGLQASGREIPLGLDDPIGKVIQSIVDSPKVGSDRELLLAIRKKLEGDDQVSDQLLTQYFENAPELSIPQYNLLKALVVDEKLASRIDARSFELYGMTLPELLSAAEEVVQRDGEAAGLDFIKMYQVNGKPLEEITYRLAVCQLLTRLESDQALDAWKKMAEDFREFPRVLKEVIATPVVRRDTETRVKLIQYMRDCFEDGVDWQLEEIALQLEQDDSEKAAAAALVRLDELQPQAPSNPTAYGLMVVAYERIGQPAKAAAVLQKAIQIGAARPEYYLRAAQLLMQQEEEFLAVDLAQKLVAQPDVSRNNLIGAVKVLGDAREYLKATEAMQKILPDSWNDADEEFAMASIYAVNAVQAGKSEEARRQILPLAQSSDRWFDLYLSLTNLDALRVPTAKDWLNQAADWGGDSMHRWRNLSAAWRSLAKRASLNERAGYYHLAVQAMREVMNREPTDVDTIQFANLHERAGDSEGAVRLYQEIANSDRPVEFRAFALNNLAMLTEDALTAEGYIRKAIELSPAADYVDTLAMILTRQDRQADAIDLLEASLADYPADVVLQIRLTDLLLNASELERANGVLEQLVQQADQSDSLKHTQWQEIRELQTRFSRILEIKAAEAGEAAETQAAAGESATEDTRVQPVGGSSNAQEQQPST